MINQNYLKKILVLFTFLLLSIEANYASESIKIGLIAAKSGAAATNQRRIFMSARLAAEQINLKGGVLGKQIKLIELDNKTTSLGSKIAAQKAVSENVTAVIGCVRSSNSLAAGHVLQKAKTIMISPISTNPKVTLIGDYVFRVCFLDSLQGQIMANFAIKDIGSKRAVVLTNTSYTYSIDLSDFFKRQYEKLGGEVVWAGDFIENMSDFSSILLPTKKLNPDVIFLPAYVRESGLIIRQAKEMGINAIFLAGDGWGIDIFNYAKEAVNGSYLIDHWYPTVDTEISQKYVKDFLKKYNTSPEAGSALTFDAMNIVADAIERANSLDKSKIRDSLAATKGFKGVTGKISFDKNGDPIKSAVIMKMEKNKRKFVKSITP